MNLKSILHTTSHLKWVFMAAQVILIAYCLFVLPDNLIEMSGIVIFLTGIQLGLDSLGDLEKMSTKDRIRYQNRTFIQLQSRILISAMGVLVLISTLFMALKFIFPGKPLFDEFFYLGLNCWALILGLLCLLKSAIDKAAFVQPNND